MIIVIMLDRLKINIRVDYYIIWRFFIMNITFDNTIKDISNFIIDQGFYYTDEQIYNFYVSLKTKPFVIISGISGSGKSKIANLFADYMEKSYNNKDNYELIPVKPNWTDNRGIFGFHNVLNDTYEITPTLKLFIRALKNPTKPFFLVLDEMNLAKVEYYFSDFLSLLESRRVIKPDLDKEFKKIYSKLNNISLSEAIILSAIQLQSNSFKQVEEFRNTEICQWWLKNISKGSNDTAQFRTELNQGRSGKPLNDNGYRADGSRLAGKAFWSKEHGKSYMLKELKDMDEDTRKRVEKLIEAFVLEPIQIEQKKIQLHNSLTPLKTSSEQQDFSDTLMDLEGYFVPKEIEIPLNVFVIGTVNVDETTYMFSPKVLDRSNVIEFNDVDLYGAYGYGMLKDTSETLPISARDNIDLKLSIATADITRKIVEKYGKTFDILNDIFENLKIRNKHFGYRVFNEISLFVFNYIGLNANEIDQKSALDIQIIQKILPKLNGTDDEILKLMEELLEIAKVNGLIRSQSKIERMIMQLRTTGYTTFIE